MYRRLFLRIVVAIWLTSAGPSLVFSQAPTPKDVLQLHTDLIEIRVRRLELEAKKTVWEHEKRQLSERNPLGIDKDRAAPMRAWTPLLREYFRDAHFSRGKRLQKLEETLKEQHARSQKLWRDAQVAEAKVGVDEMAAKATGGPLDAAAVESVFWDRETTAIVAWGVLIVAVSFLLGLHSLRREIRRGRRLNGSFVVAASLGFVLLCCQSPASRADGHADESWETKEAKKLLTDIHVATRHVAEMEKGVNRLRDEISLEQTAMLSKWAAAFPSGEGESFQDQAFKEQQDAVEKVHGLLILAETIRMASKDGLTAAEEGARKRRDLDAELSRQRERTRGKILAKIGLSCVFMVLAFLPLGYLDRSSRKEQAQQAKQCPRCLQEGSLQAESADDEHPTSAQLLKCVGADGQEGCEYAFRAKYQKWPRLCFPTVGIRSSGKTHWLVTAYDRIKHHREQMPVVVQTAPNETDAEFEQKIEEILEQHNAARATPHHRQDIPYPLIFHVRDADRLGRNRAMLNLFDFSGELMLDNAKLLRRRALLMDGFTLFLDPTQVRKGKGGLNLSLKEQMQTLKNFYEDMCDMRGLDVGAVIPVPIAVCVSKLDLVVNHSYGGAARPWVKALRDSFARDPYSLAGIQKRSELCEQAMQIMFDGWNVTQTLRENFGNSFRYFPMTPINLVETELGLTDVRNRTSDPVGILQPVLWLLHMHGYTLFK